jgi:hypothetical protein
MAEHTLRNEQLLVCIDPARGGKITSLRSIASGREWLWTNPYLPASQARYGDSYIALHDTGGIDECFPTVDANVCSTLAATWQGVELPDHGELFHQAWRTIQTDDPTELCLEARGVRIPYRFRRTLKLGSGPLDLSYELQNLADHRFPYTWCIHPIFAIEPDMQIMLPADTPIRTEAATGRVLWRPGQVFNWPDCGEIDLSVVPDPAVNSYGGKLFAGPMADGWAGIQTSAERLMFRFSEATIPFVAMWMNFGAWTGADTPNYYNLVLEPSIGDADSLNQALERKSAVWIEPAETHTWALSLGVESIEDQT